MLNVEMYCWSVMRWMGGHHSDDHSCSDTSVGVVWFCCGLFNFAFIRLWDMKLANDWNGNEPDVGRGIHGLF